MPNSPRMQSILAIALGLALLLLPLAGLFSPAFAQVNSGTVSGSVVGDNNMSADNTGVAVNGDTNGANINNNQNTVNSTTSNSVNPVLYAPSQTSTSGGSSALVLPRNPLPMPNASLGRSNFGMQVGIQNNPGLAALTGQQNALGWFAQAGITIPFGKIPDILQNRQNIELDKKRIQRLENNRDVFGNTVTRPPASRPALKVGKTKVASLGAYDYATAPDQKITPVGSMLMPPSLSVPQPRVLALEPAGVFTQPLNTGQKIGAVEVGKEYPYLGHTRSGWVKVLMPTGREGWAKSNFEYIKRDYTEVDELEEIARGVARKKSVAVKDGDRL